MLKFLKIISTILISLILIGIISSILFVTMVNPNRFKPVLTEQVKKATGRELIINGDLSWTFYPNLGIKIGNVQLKNPAGFKDKTFAEIDHATVVVKLLPLLHAQIQSSGIALHGMKLHLIKNANGKTNWQDLQSTSSTSTSKSDTSSQPNLPPAALGLAISSIDISNAEVSFVNQQSKQSYEIKNFEFHAKDVNLTNPFSVKSSFDVKSQNADMTGKIKFSTMVAPNLTQQVIALNNIQLNADIRQAQKKFDIVSSGNLVADLAQKTIQLNNLVTRIANLTLQGQVDVADFANAMRIKGHMQVQPFDVKKWLQATGQDMPALHQLTNAKGYIDFAMTSSSPFQMTGVLQAETLKANKITITNIQLNTRMQNNVLQLTSATADFYQGKMQAQGSVNLTSAVPKVNLQATANNVQAQPLFADIAGDQKIKMTGTGSVAVQVTTQGKEADAIMKNLDGAGRISFNDGILQGIDIGYLLENANALAHGKSTSRTDTGRTEFGTLTASAVINNGVLTNKDLLLNSPRFDVKGSGSINLINQTINYKLNTSSKQFAEERKDLKNLYGLTIPITITGNLTNPTIRLDAQSLMTVVAEQQLERAKAKLTDKVKDKIKDKIPGEAAELLGNILGR